MLITVAFKALEKRAGLKRRRVPVRSLSPASSIDFSPFYEHRPPRIGRVMCVSCPDGGVGWERKRGETTPYVRANTAVSRNPYNERHRRHAFHVHADPHTGALRESERDVRAGQKYCVRGPHSVGPTKNSAGQATKNATRRDAMPRHAD